MTSKPNNIDLPDFETLKRFLFEEREAYKKKYKVKLTNQTNQEKVFVLSIISSE